ncbi:Sodium-dependent serotonin transporter [Trichinella pseudospiralis]|uniref:Sodium-dependent serotonin transporter n=1 Tax=Trichinella pseudospiralis TaxID=6337 RepID=A0A0V1IAW5_TRIPS|nr:Sodium-dependent serotonin transporter [Trichinella pseudospiralis]
MGQQGRISVGHNWLFRRSWQCMALSIHMLSKWWRSFSGAIFCYVHLLWTSVVLYGNGIGTISSMRMHFHMETTGVGYATCLIDVYMGCFYNTIISWALFYLSSSFKWPFPWQSCDNVWNTENCIPDNATVSLGNTSSNYTNAAEEFFLRRVLEIQNSDGLENLGNIRWPLLLCLLVIYTIVYFAIWRGPLSSGKAVWFTATIPYVALFALLAHSCTLPGSQAGIKYFLMPDWSKLLNIEVWIDAATQIFFSLGPGFGVLIALASYNSRRNNFYRDAIVAGCINSLTSILSGLVIFSVLGYMADCLNKDIGEVAETGGVNGHSCAENVSFHGLLSFF